MNSNHIKEVPSASLPPVVQPNNQNFLFTPGGSDLALWLFFFLGVWKATPSNLRELRLLKREKSESQTPRKNKKKPQTPPQNKE